LGRGAQQAADDGVEGWRARWASRAAGMVPGLGRGGREGCGLRVEGTAEREGRRGRGRREGARNGQSDEARQNRAEKMNMSN
jgi:hypothetical protein